MSDATDMTANVIGCRGVRLAALRASVLLSLLFLVVYTSTNWITSLRSDVGTWVYAWERWIPFVPIMILPYMSIDLFFVAAPFLCADRGELRTLSRRITLAILLAGACVLLMPLQLGWPRPAVSGWLGVVYDQFRSFDRPYNLCPSLHIALRTLLADLYARHARGAMRLLVHAWFSLIGFSTLLTGQHHVIDVVGGFVLAAFCFWIVSPAPWRVPSLGNRRVGALYAIGAAALGALALLLRGHGGWALWWPALACGLVGAAYLLGPLGPGGAIYRKHDGRVPLATRLLLMPTLAGQWMSWLWYRWRGGLWYRWRGGLWYRWRGGFWSRSRGAPWHEAAPGVWIGRAPTRREAESARAAGVTAVLDLTAEFSQPRAFRGLPYLNVALLDLTAPDEAQRERCLSFIEAHAASGIVYVHCKAGYSRSAAVVGSWLLRRGLVGSVDEAVEALRRARPGLVVRPEAQAAIG